VQFYLVATIIDIQSVRSQICVYIHKYFTIFERWLGKINFKKFGIAVNAVCHFGHACYRFDSPDIGGCGFNVTESE